MKRVPMRSAVLTLAACCIAGEAAAQSSVTVYGRINTALEYSSASTATDGTHLGGTGRLTNNRSVFGLRGEEDLGGTLKAIWQIESNVSLDTGQGQIAGRNDRIGLQGKAGTFFMGHWQTPYTVSTMGYDPYYPTTAGYMALIGNGSASSSDNVQDTSSFDRRQKNIIVYQTPSFAGFSGSAAWGINEEKLTVPRNPGLYSFSAAYDNGPLNVALAYEIHQNYQVKGRNDDAMKAGVSYRFPSTTVALLYERLHYRTATGDLTRNGYYASLVQKLGPGSVKLGFALASNGTGNATETVGFFRSGADTGATQVTIGYDYPLSKRTTLFAYYSRIDNKKNAIYDFAINELGVSAGADPQTFALGMRHFF
ncbi:MULTISPECIES: porin [Cupriavidus]|uniref:Porin, Gram-negative type n=1 Tax=Cupriavidus pinatubonensis (strain JMP 134 / LMG 1197) TaxID=264198 RepID=Q46NU1_CUPPJ|nr:MULTISPECIES: porin [Cupriavidus]QYY29422.1 porin [Cupriavidus pinatubonensis]TPQ44116.1 porin [Cupriavidus pinatubonensis]